MISNAEVRDSFRAQHHYDVGFNLGGVGFETVSAVTAGQVNTIRDQLKRIEQSLEATADPHVKHLIDTLAKGRPTKPRMMMAVAHLMALRSTCSRLQVGCVITDAAMSTIYSVGYNGNYAGGPNECDSSEPGTCGCLHAEDNALVKLRTEAFALQLFTTHSPCVICSKRIVNQGRIDQVWYAEAYRDQTGLDILRDAQIKPEAL